MQKTTLIVALSLCISMITGVAEARNTKKSTSSTTTTTTMAPSERIETHQAAPEHHSGGVSFAVGVSSIAGTPAPGAASTGSLTAILDFTSLDAVQILAGITQTTGGFGFGIGGIYKRTIFGGENAGFHLGAGLGLGTIAGNFAMSIPGVVGVHYTLSGTPIAIHLDGGPVFSLVNVSNGIGSSTQTNFAIGQLSSLLGASVVYNF